ncbi:hypothetical protein HMPREF1572_00779 [Gardnerella vaginalis JCP7275]|uniref:Uncharacterized protein n=1 Tax=Gardnerella vaginalis JCP8108 TaxID=1261066 RepID=S4H044_GARVA|nr:hypothetical protein HMPREF1581_00441 [Gardnerella vaginalis JCP8108]EPI56550.1 hypothetical protein HMPREF1572_00779 [Gardnerella vaginalis JCP7275]
MLKLAILLMLLVCGGGRLLFGVVYSKVLEAACFRLVKDL